MPNPDPFKRRLLILQKFSSELVEDQKQKEKKGCNHISKHSKFNLASNNTPNLTQLTSMTWKTSTSTTKKGRGTTFKKFNFNASSIEISKGVRLKPQKPL